MADETEEMGFLSRWSQRKQTARVEEAAPAPELQQSLLSEEEEEARRQELEDYVAQLPEPESLTYESDFTAFFKEGVPEALKRRALRVLWRSNPTLANLDGLIDYGQDFTDKAMVVPNLKTLYRVGKGMFSDEDLAIEERKRAGLPPETETQEPPAESSGAETPQDETAEAEEAGEPVEETAAEARLSTNQPQPINPQTAREGDLSAKPVPAKSVGGGKRSALSRRWGAEG